MDMDANTLRAVKMLGDYTNGRFDVWGLAGPDRAGLRTQVMAALLGLPKVPKAKAGVNVIIAEFYARMKPEGGCPSHREDAFVEMCRAAIG
jgi:hypothetical protein